MRGFGFECRAAGHRFIRAECPYPLMGRPASIRATVRAISSGSRWRMTRGVADGDGCWRDVASDNRSGTDDTVVADRHAGQDEGRIADVAVPTDGDRGAASDRTVGDDLGADGYDGVVADADLVRVDTVHASEEADVAADATPHPAVDPFFQVVPQAQKKPVYPDQNAKHKTHVITRSAYCWVWRGFLGSAAIVSGSR